MPKIQVSVSELLKQETAAQHLLTEQLLLPRLLSVRSSQDYAGLLQLFYGFFAPLQARVTAFLTPADLPDLPQRRTSQWIRDDLAALGFPSLHTSVCRQLPPITSPPHAWGALYVMEGSTLGGKMIRNMLLDQGGSAISPAHTRYFTGYGAETGSRWKTFLEALNQQQEQAQTIIMAAQTTFLSFKDWIQLNKLHEPV